MGGRYADVLTLIQHQFPKFILLLDKFILVELTSHTNWHKHSPMFKQIVYICPDLAKDSLGKPNALQAIFPHPALPL